MDENKNRTPLAEEDRPLVDRVDERVDEKLKDRLAGTVDPRVDQRIDQRIDERIDERVQERLDNRTNQPVANRPDTDRDNAFQRPPVTGEHPDERLMEERADRFARERAERLARERTEHDADMRARQLNDERLEHERMEHDRMEHERLERERMERERLEQDRMVDERANRMADERADRMADERVDRMADERANRMVDDRPVVERTRPPMASRIIYWLLGVIEAVLAVRLLLRLVGANAANGIVSTIYNITDFLVAPFRGIVPEPPVAGLDVQTLVAMVAYAIIGFALAKLIDVLTPNRIR